MKKYVIWKKVNGITEHSDTYYAMLSIVIDEAQIVINSLKDSNDWKEVAPEGIETKRWENKKGDRIYISEQP